MLMLVLMTFNGYVILAIVLGTSAGRYRYYEDIEDDRCNEVCILHCFNRVYEPIAVMGSH